MLPRDQVHRTRGDVPLGIREDHVLAKRDGHPQGGDVREERRRLGEVDDEGRVVGRLDTKGLEHRVDVVDLGVGTQQLSAALDIREDVRVPGSVARVNEPLPAIDEVAGHDRLAIAVGDAFLQGEGNGHSVSADLPVRQTWNDVQVAVEVGKRVGKGPQHLNRRAVGRLGRIKRRRLTANVDPQNLGRQIHARPGAFAGARRLRRGRLARRQEKHERHEDTHRLLKPHTPFLSPWCGGRNIAAGNRRSDRHSSKRSSSGDIQRSSLGWPSSPNRA